MFLTALALPLICWSLQAQGLKFSGQTVMIHERTSLDVFGLSGQTFRETIELSFDFCSYPAARFGYITRITDKKEAGPTLNISFDGRGDLVVVQLNEEGRRAIVQMEMHRPEYRDHVWIPVSLRIDTVKDSVWFKFGDRYAAEQFDCRHDRMTPVIQFGLSGHVVDVPSFAIRNLVVKDNRHSIQFPLDEAEGEILHDSRGRRMGSVKNPNWMMTEARRWEKLTTLESESPGGVIYSPNRKSVLMYNSDELKSFNVTNGVTNTRHTTSHCPMNILLGTSFLRGNKLFAYELNDWKNNNRGVSLVSLSLDTMDWETLSEQRLDGQMHHHGAFINPFTDEYTFFGGFGNRYYNGDFIALDGQNRWHVIWDEQKEGRTLYPRFFAATGLDAEKRYAYIFGGMGNESGEQVVGRRYFYDLHRVDLQTGECTRLWDLDHKGEDFVPARNLIVDGEYFYVLCYPEYLSESVMHLYKFSIADGSSEVLADGINVNSDKIWCSSSLYLDRNLGKFIVTASSVNEDLRPHTDIYTLLYPPAPFVETTFFEEHKGLLIAAAIVLLLGAVLGIDLLVRRRARTRREAESYAKSKADQHRKVFRQERRPNAIYLFGDFMVTDRDGTDISDSFSKQQRTLLFLLLRYMQGGLSSSRMSSILWPDKEEDKVKNSRGVAVNSLRKNLSRLDGFSILYSGGLFSLQIEKPGYCDFIELSGLTPDNGIDGMLSIISRGRFLQGITDPEFDSFKDQVETNIAPILAEDIKKRYVSGQYRAAIEISDMILAFDPLDENALHYAVHALLAIRRRDDALLRYASFASEYLRTNDETYPVKFEKV